MKKKIISGVAALTLTFNIGMNVYAVKDIGKHWAEPSIKYLIDKKIMSGYGDDTFKPDNMITRAEFLKIVNNVYENQKSKEIDFKDVKEKDWFYKDIGKAVGAGYIEGYTDNTVKPNEPITRQEASKIIVKASRLEKLTVNKKVDFKDKDTISDWALVYVDIMVEKGYIKGYEDNTFRPNRNLSRGEAAKILSGIKEEIEIDKQIQEDKEKEEEEQKPPVESVYSVQVGSFATEKEALNLASKLLKAGYKDTFISKDNYNIYYVIANDFKERSKAEGFVRELDKKGYEALVSKKDFRKYTIIIPKLEEEKPPAKTKAMQFTEMIKELPEAKNIDKLTEKILLGIENSNNFYNKLNEKEKKTIVEKDLNKLRSVEKKVNSMKTDILSPTKTTVEQAQAWAVDRGSHQRFVDIAPEFWKYGELTGINPEILYAQAAKETNFGKYTGSVKPEMNNWAGIKTDNPSGDKTYDHETFETPEDGVRAQFNHMGIYVGVEPIGDPHPRWYVTSKVSWRGSVKKVEDLGGKWAPSRDYGISIMRDYVNQIYKF